MFFIASGLDYLVYLDAGRGERLNAADPLRDRFQDLLAMIQLSHPHGQDMWYCLRYW